MTDNARTLYKLMVLFLLNQIDAPLSNATISDFMLQYNYTGYFNIQQALAELADEHLIATDSTYKSTYFRITKEGREALSFFGNELSDEIRADIMQYLKEHHFSLLRETSLKADYRYIKKNEYLVACSLTEQDKCLLELKLTVPTEAASKDICSGWETHNQEIYAFLLKKLLDK